LVIVTSNEAKINKKIFLIFKISLNFSYSIRNKK
jgi:hypothetical protein